MSGKMDLQILAKHFLQVYSLCENLSLYNAKEYNRQIRLACKEVTECKNEEDLLFHLMTSIPYTAYFWALGVLNEHAKT